MKLTEIANTIVDLSDNPPSSIIPKLKCSDVVLYEGTEHTIEIEPKKLQKGAWIIGLEALHRPFDKQMVKIVETIKLSMTEHEKKVMRENICKICKMFEDNEKRLIEIAQSYYHNLAIHNSYADSCVREIMALFPITILKNGKIIL